MNASNKTRVFQHDCAEAMAHAFRKVCEVLRIPEDDLDRRNFIADRIIKMAQDGITTPQGLYLRSIVAEVDQNTAKRPDRRAA